MKNPTKSLIGNSRSGFTLIEILLAFLLFVIIFSVFAETKGGSEQNVRQNMRRDIALRLLQSKMTETEMKQQNLIDKNGVETSFTEEHGKFDEPYQDYSWHYKLQAPTIKFTSDTLVNFLVQMGMDKDEAMAQIDQEKLLITNLNKNIQSNFGELIVDVTWDYLGPQKLQLLTHIVPKAPKIELTTTADAE